MKKPTFRALALTLALLLAVAPALAGPINAPTSSPTRSPISSPFGEGANPNLVFSWSALHGLTPTVGIGAVGSDTRATTRTVRDSSGAWQTVAINAAGIETYYGRPELAIDPGKTNYFLNSDSPATQTTASLATGTWCLWLEGSGSVTVSAGTATITGAGTASAGTPLVFSVTVGGSVVCTVSGSPSRAQLEQSPVPTAYIPTAGSATARAADAHSIPIGAIVGGLPQTMITVVAKWRPKFINPNLPNSTSLGIVSVAASANSLLYVVRDSGGSALVRSYDGTTTASTAITYAANTAYYIAAQANNSGAPIAGLATGKFRTGYSADGITWTWGTAANSDGAFVLTGGNIYLGYGVAYPLSIGMIKIYKTVLSSSDLYRSITAERAEFVPSLLAHIRKTWERMEKALWLPESGLAWGGAS